MVPNIKYLFPVAIFVLLISVVHAASSPCTLNPDPGPCRASIPAWYFDYNTMECTEFTYGGCKGVVPFTTLRKCKRAHCRKNKCFSKPDRGPCKSYFPRWFYDRTIGGCQQFIYGGCGGNVPFVTNAECRAAQCNPACTQIPHPGFCKARFIRYFFDNVQGKCKKFIWRGCGGSVPFETLQDCEIAQCIA